MTTTILIVGAIGKQGGAVISALLSSLGANLSLRFLTRDPGFPASLRLVARGAQALKGDLYDTASLDRATQGVDRAFLVTDMMVGEAKEVLSGKNFVDAAQRAGVGHVVFTSVRAADTATSVPHFRSKYAVELYLQASGMSYTILRPAAFMDNIPASPGIARFLMVGIFFAMMKYKPTPFIAVEDIGIIAAKALLAPENEDYRSKTLTLVAAEYDLSGVREAIHKAQGYVPWLASWTPQWLSYLLPGNMQAAFDYFDKHGYPPVDMALLKRIHPGMLTMEDYFRKV